MLGGDQGANEMKGGLAQGLKSFGAIVPLIEDQGDVIAGLRQIAVMGSQVLGDGTELDAVMDIAGIDAVKQRDMKIGAHQQSQIHLPQIASLLLVMTALREFRRGACIDVGEEVGAIVNQSAEVQLE